MRNEYIALEANDIFLSVRDFFILDQIFVQQLLVCKSRLVLAFVPEIASPFRNDLLFVGNSKTNLHSIHTAKFEVSIVAGEIPVKFQSAQQVATFTLEVYRCLMWGIFSARVNIMKCIAKWLVIVLVNSF